MVFMMNPSVGLIVLTSSFISRLTIVVLPALSNPLFGASAKVANLRRESTHSIKILISLSFNRALRKIESIVSLRSLLQRTGNVCLWRFRESCREAKRLSFYYFSCSPTKVVVDWILALHNESVNLFSFLKTPHFTASQLIFRIW